MRGDDEAVVPETIDGGCISPLAKYPDVPPFIGKAVVAMEVTGRASDLDGCWSEAMALAFLHNAFVRSVVIDDGYPALGPADDAEIEPGETAALRQLSRSLQPHLEIVGDPGLLLVGWCRENRDAVLMPFGGPLKEGSEIRTLIFRLATGGHGASLHDHQVLARRRPAPAGGAATYLWTVAPPQASQSRPATVGLPKAECRYGAWAFDGRSC